MEIPDGKRVSEYARRIQKLLQNHLLEDPAAADPFITEARNLRIELEHLGLLVTYEAHLDPETNDFRVSVVIWKPKENMSPAEAAIYDEWLKKRMGVE